LLVFWLRIPGLSAVGRSLYRKIAEERMRISSWFGLGACGVPLVAAGAGGVVVPMPLAAPPESPRSEAADDVEPPAEPEERAEAKQSAEAEAPDEPEAGADTEPDAPAESRQDEAPGKSDGEGEAPSEEQKPEQRGSDPAIAWFGTDRLKPPIRREIASSVTFVREVAVALLILAMGSQLLMENRYVHRFIRAKQPEWAAYVVHYPRTFQGWGMFAPEPPYDDGHVVIDARTVDGRKIDPQTGLEPVFDPYAPKGWDHGQFQCDYENRIRFPGNGGYRPFFRDWLLRYHERTGNPKDQLVAFDVWWVGDKSPPPGQLKGEPLPPAKILSHGFVQDSLATPWLTRRQP
jgi:hypothetical protein